MRIVTRKPFRSDTSATPLGGQHASPCRHGQSACLAQATKSMSMRNLVILGSGRSGTSMVAALFRGNAGVFYGYELLDATPANPFGYYEDHVLNAVNNALIRRMHGMSLLETLPRRLESLLTRLLIHPICRDTRALWLAAPSGKRLRRVPWELQRFMRIFAARQPFCFKDPRFNVTLPLWRPHLPAGTRFIVVYRDPDRTVDSMLRHAREGYEPPLPLTPHWAFTTWYRSYRCILDEWRRPNDWLIVHYDQIVDGRALPALGRFAEADLDCSEIDGSCSRSNPRNKYTFSAAARARCLYRLLQERSKSDIETWSPGSRRPRGDSPNVMARA